VVRDVSRCDRENLEGDLPTQPAVPRPIHFAHATGTERRENLVRAQGEASRQRHARRSAADRGRDTTIFGPIDLGGIEVTCLAVDKTGALWIGTSNGVYRRLANQRFEHYSDREGLPANDVNAIVSDRHGRIWVGTRSSGLGLVTVDSLSQRAAVQAAYSTRNGLPANWIHQIFEGRDGVLWAGTAAGLVEIVPAAEPTRCQFRAVGPALGLVHPGVLSVAEDRHHNLWVAGTTGAAKIRPDGFTIFGAADGIRSASSGSLWIGFSAEGGLVRYRRGRFERFGTDHGVPHGAIRNLGLDRNDRLWGASSRGGLLRVDGVADGRPAFSRYTTAQGLSSNEVTAVVEDTHGRIYAGTARGLDRLDPATGRIRTYRAGEGLPIGEMLAAIRDRAGVMWASYNSGLVRIVPTDDPPSVVPSVLITGLRVAGQTQPLSALGQAELQFFELPWNRNSLEVDFVSPGFGPADGLRYQIKLEGGDSDWSSPSEQRRILYANLAPGHYRFLARATNADGVMSNAAASFSFTILPPIWQRWWFRSLLAALVVALAYAIYRYRVSRLLEVAAMRTRIAADLHDDIGANLTRIAVLSEVVRRQRPDADDRLASIAAVARESVTAMSDIVWAISPGRDGLHDLTRKMREHAEEVFAAGETELTFAGPDATRDVRLSVDMRRDIYLIFKEAINNAARHADCSRVNVGFRAEGTRLILSIADDGEGFDASAEGDGNGLVSMRNRAKRLTAKFDITSRPGEGTTVRLEVPQRRVH
jgi:signal transduction histidine kinase/sugar lactone lactonase YvrE